MYYSHRPAGRRQKHLSPATFCQYTFTVKSGYAKQIKIERKSPAQRVFGSQATFCSRQYPILTNQVVNHTSPQLNRHILKTITYYFDVTSEEAMNRNGQRQGKACIPIAGLRNVYRRLEKHAFEEGFDEISTIHANAGQFTVTPPLTPRFFFQAILRELHIRSFKIYI